MARFEELAEYKAGRTPARARSAYWGGKENGVPWVAISDMTEFGTVHLTKEKISQAAFGDVFRGHAVPAGTMLMSFKLTIGRIATLGLDAVHNEAIIAIYPKVGVDQRYLGYFLSQVDFKGLQDRQVKGNTLNQEKIDRIEVLVPPSGEQAMIADILDLVRRAIQIQEAILSATTALKRAAMRTLFTRGLRGEAQKETEIGPVPESWEVEALSQSVEPPEYGYTASASWEPLGPRFLRITDIQDGAVNWASVPYCLCEESTVTDKRLVNGDIVVARIGGTTGKSFFIHEAPEAVFASYMIRLRARHVRLLPKYLYHYMQGDAYWRHIAENKGGRLKGGVNVPVLLSLPLVRPGVEEQGEIVAILDALDRKIDLHRRKRTVLEELFQALLRKLMTGKIRVGDLNLAALKENVAAEVGAG